MSADLVNERMDQIHNFLRPWQEVYTTMVFEGEERFPGPMSHLAQLSDHEALAKLLRDQRMKLEEEELRRRVIRAYKLLWASLGCSAAHSAPSYPD